MATVNTYRKLYTKIRLEILGADLVIEDADISIELKKTDEKKNNTCEIIIYNLSDDTYARINNKTNSVRAYVDLDGTGYTLFFQGDLRELQKHTKTRKAVKKPRKSKKPAVIHYNEPSILREFSGADVATRIMLQDGINNYFLDNYIVKSYSGQVTNKYILQDVLSIIKKNNNVEISANFDDIAEYTFPNGYSVKDSCINIATKMATLGGCKCKINNNIIIIRSDTIDGDNFGYVLNGDICNKPEAKSDKQIEITAPFLPTVNPLDDIKLEFKDYNGVYRVKCVESKIDNFGQNYETTITVQYE